MCKHNSKELSCLEGLYPNMERKGPTGAMHACLQITQCAAALPAVDQDQSRLWFQFSVQAWSNRLLGDNFHCRLDIILINQGEPQFQSLLRIR
jgi:hypothetical protein